MEVRVKQLAGVKFSVQAGKNSLISDQPTDNGGDDSGMTPPELLLASLASCAAYYAAEYLRTRNLAVTGVEVAVTAEKLKSPARVGDFRISVTSPVALSSEQREAMLRSVQHCVVHNTLRNPPEIRIEIEARDSVAAPR